MGSFKHAYFTAAAAAGGLALLIATGGGAAAGLPKLETKKVAPRTLAQPCSQTHAPRFAPNLARAGDPESLVEDIFRAEHDWGIEENVKIMREGPASFLRVHYPEGSINPGNDKAPRGGAGFLSRASAAGNVQDACLHYKVRFEDGFEFVKGGKLPGLYGGKAPSGGEKVTGKAGWSVRLMWRKKGEGELYEYVANKKGKYGASIGRGEFVFPTGRWVSIDLQTKLNDPGEANGEVRLWVDGRQVVEQTDVVFRTVANGGVEGLMFSTFFGGNDKEWESPKDQHVDFADFTILTKE